MNNINNDTQQSGTFHVTILNLLSKTIDLLEQDDFKEKAINEGLDYNPPEDPSLNELYCLSHKIKSSKYYHSVKISQEHYRTFIQAYLQAEDELIALSLQTQRSAYDKAINKIKSDNPKSTDASIKPSIKVSDENLKRSALINNIISAIDKLYEKCTKGTSPVTIEPIISSDQEIAS